MTLIVSCGKSSDKKTSDESPLAKVEASQALWKQKKASYKAYAYTTGVSYEFGKKAWSTTVAVEQDQPSCRKYEHKELVDSIWKTTESWTENKDSLGLNPVGFSAKTYDQLYIDCLNLLKSNTVRPINVEFFEDGLLKGCYTECTDKCYSDIHLNDIRMDQSSC